MHSSIHTPPTAELANLEMDDQEPFHAADATSPSAMIIDTPEELAVDGPETDDIQLNDAELVQSNAPPKPVATDSTFSGAIYPPRRSVQLTSLF